MQFGPFDKENVFHIEESIIYKNLQKNIKIAEFVLIEDTKVERTFYIVEAKSSSPRSKGELDEFVNEISDKLLNSLLLTTALHLKRHCNFFEGLPSEFKKSENYSLKTVLLLVIKGHKKEWLIPVNDKLNVKMRDIRKIWPLDVLVINDSIACEKRLICELGV